MQNTMALLTKLIINPTTEMVNDIDNQVIVYGVHDML